MMGPNWSPETNAFQSTAASAPDINQTEKMGEAGRECKQLSKFNPVLNMNFQIFQTEYVS